MGEKISGMPLASVMANSDVLAGLVAGSNFQIPRSVVLAAGVGENIELTNAGGFCRMGSDGSFLVRAGGSAPLQMVSQAGSSFVMLDDGTVDINVNGGSPFHVRYFGALRFQVLGSGQIKLTPGVGENTTILRAEAPAAGSDPASHGVVALPLSIFGVVGAGEVLATPDAWVPYFVNGVEYRVPGYLA